MADDRQLYIKLILQDQTKRGFDSVNRQVKGTQKSLFTLKNAVLAVAGSLVVKQTLELANTYQNLQNRLKLVTESAGELATVQQELFEISQRTRGGFAETVELYQKLALQSQNLGLQSSELSQITENVNKVIAIAGVNSVQASAGILQLSQAFASGRLQGDEFRSISENIPPLLDIFAKELGVTRGELKKLGSEGKITSEIIATALLKETENINDAFSQLSPTLGQASTTIANSFLNLAGQLSETTGVADALAGALIGVSKAIDGITESLKVTEPTIRSTRERMKELKDEVKGTRDELENLAVLELKGAGAGIDILLDDLSTQVIEDKNREIKRLSDQLLELERIRIERDTAIGVITDKETSNNINETNSALKEYVKTNQNSAGAFSQGQSGALKFNQELITQKRILADISKNILPDTNTELGRFGQIGQDNSALLDELNKARFPAFEKALKDAGDTTAQLDILFTNTFNGFADTLADALMTGKFAFKDFARSVIADIARMIARQQALLFYQKAFGFLGGSLFGIPLPAPVTPAPIAQNGRPAFKGQPLTVGEVGMEMFVPQENGYIVPNNKLGGTNVNITINTVDARGIDELLTSRRNTIVNVINDALNRQGKEALV